MRTPAPIAVAAISAALVMSLTGCDYTSSKLAEPYNDAAISSKDDSPAEVLSMPDGFSNVATKCDRHGNRVYVIFHLDSPYGALSVVAADPSCKQ